MINLLTSAKRKRDLVDKGSKSSTMRHAFITGTELVVWGMILVFTILITQVFRGETVTWEGAAVFIGALVGLWGALAGMKNWEKRIENKPNNSENERTR
jgi:hypothetical protein